MITPGFGVGELLVGFIEVAFSLALPVALLFMALREFPGIYHGKAWRTALIFDKKRIIHSTMKGV